jgi:hypothetical protein
MGTAVRPAKTSPGPWDSFADVDVFVDEVLAELVAMAKDGARPMRSGTGATLGVRRQQRSHCRSTPVPDRLRAHLSALMTYRVAADLLEQRFPIDAGTDPETLRRHTLRVGEAVVDRAASRPDTSAPAITVTLDSTFIRSCEDGERHLGCGLATSKRNRGHDRFSVTSRKPIRTSRY